MALPPLATAKPVLVAGAGCAGLVAALAAAKGGARVDLFDVVDPSCASSSEESNTARSTGLIPAAGTQLQHVAGVFDDTPEIMFSEIATANHGECDLGLLAQICIAAGPTVDWLSECGIDLICFTDFLYHGHSKFRMHGPRRGYGRGLVRALAARVAEEPLVRRRYGVRVCGVIASPEGNVIGLRCSVQNGAADDSFDVLGCAVIMATNGFGGNKKMISDYVDSTIGIELSRAHYQGSPHITGDGLIWGQDFGGELQHMGAYQGHATVTVSQTPMLVTYAVIVNGGILVNSLGRRFGNENVGYSEFSAAVLAQGPSAIEIFGAQTFAACKGTRLDEVVEAGLVSEHVSLESVAVTYDLPLETLQQTVDEVYKASADGMPDAFGRVWGPATLTPDPPFYTICVQAALFHTQGGLRVDQHARVIASATGEPIPKLFAAGGVAAGVSGDNVEGYLSGNGLLTAVVFGKAGGSCAASLYREQLIASKL